LFFFFLNFCSRCIFAYPNRTFSPHSFIWQPWHQSNSHPCSVSPKKRGGTTLIEIFALKATLCNFKILPDPGREELVGRGPKWGDFALAAVQKFRQTTLAQRQKHWQWPKRRRRTKENKKTKRMANGNLFSFPTSPKKKTREASK